MLHQIAVFGSASRAGFVSRTGSVVVSKWLSTARSHVPLRLHELDPEARYVVEGVEGLRSGAAWMRLGVELGLSDFQSTVRRIQQV